MEFEEFMDGLLAGKYTIYRKEVKKQKTSACIYLPMALEGKEVIVIIKNESK